jgi:hypothetical protein
MSRGPDAAAWLERALIRGAQEVGVSLRVDAADWTRWASVTFTGARHALQVSAAASPAFDAWLDGLAEHEFRLPGHVVADLTVTSARRGGAMTEVRIEALTVEAR